MDITHKIYYGAAAELRELKTTGSMYWEATEEYVALYNLDQGSLIIDGKGNVSLEKTSANDFSLVRLEPTPVVLAEGFTAPQAGAIGGPIVRPADHTERKNYIITLAGEFGDNYRRLIATGETEKIVNATENLVAVISTAFEALSNPDEGDPDLTFEIMYDTNKNIIGIKVNTTDKVRQGIVDSMAMFFSIEPDETA